MLFLTSTIPLNKSYHVEYPWTAKSLDVQKLSFALLLPAFPLGLSPKLFDLLQYNLGFLRIEYLDKTNIYFTDIASKFLEPKFITLNNTKFLVNNKNPYNGCWIYDKKRMEDYIKSKYFNSVQLENTKNNKKIEIRESQAFGLHNLNINYFKYTLININELNEINENCFIHHMPNNYINKKSKYGKLKIGEII